MTVNILLVEDNAADAVAIADMVLEGGGGSFFVEQVASLAEAGRRLQGGLFDLVALDLGLPDSQGLDTLTRLLAFGTDIPVVVLTGLDDEEAGARALQLGAQDYLVKDRMNADALRRIVRYTLERTRARREFEHLGRHHEMILRSIAEGVVGVDIEGRISFANPVALELLGWTADEVIGKRTCDIFCDEATGAGCRSCFSGGVDCRRTVADSGQTFRRKDGSRFPAEAACTALRAHGELAGSVVVFRDRTETLKREREIESLRRLYRAILDSAGDGIYGVDNRGITTFVNRAAVEMLARPAEELVGQGLHGLIHHTHADGSPHAARDCPIYTSFRDGRVHQEPDDVFWRPDGTSFPVAYVSTPILENGIAQGAVVVFRDISQRKRLEAEIAGQQARLERLVQERTEKLSHEVGDRIRTEVALRDSQRRLQAITENLFEGILVVDVYGHIAFANPSAERMLLKEGGERLAGRDVDTVFLLRDGDRSLPFRDGPFARVAGGGEAETSEDGLIVTADGRMLAVAWACAPLMEQDKRRGAIISFRDIRALKDAQREAFQASKLAGIGQLAAGIAHEINTPTQYIGDNLKFIAESFGALGAFLGRFRDATPEIAAAFAAADLDYLVQEIPAAAEQSLQGVAQVSRIVLAMKEFSHPGEHDKVITDINRALENTLTVCRNEWKHVAEAMVELDPNLPRVSCLAGEMNQVFLNLIVNAAHAIAAKGGGAPGTIRVATRRYQDMVEVAIADDGVGIKPEDRDRVFEPFFTTKEVGKGTGQGLAICHDVVVAKHSGQLFFESERGKGTTFFVRLPLEGGGA